MKLYIQVQDGNAINHPALEENLLDVYGEIPADWEPFERRMAPEPLNKYEYVSPFAVRYEKVDRVWTDIFETRSMTWEERKAVDDAEAAKLEAFKKRGSCEALKAHRIKLLNERIAASSDQTELNLLQTVLQAHLDHVFINYEGPPYNPPFMKYPKQDDNGNWYIPE